MSDESKFTVISPNDVAPVPTLQEQIDVITGLIQGNQLIPQSQGSDIVFFASPEAIRGLQGIGMSFTATNSLSAYDDGVVFSARLLAQHLNLSQWKFLQVLQKLINPNGSDGAGASSMFTAGTQSPTRRYSPPEPAPVVASAANTTEIVSASEKKLEIAKRLLQEKKLIPFKVPLSDTVLFFVTSETKQELQTIGVNEAIQFGGKYCVTLESITKALGYNAKPFERELEKQYPQLSGKGLQH